MGKAGHITISMILTVLIGYLFYRGVPDWGQALAVMFQGRPSLLLAGFFFVMLHMVLRAARWGVLLSPLKPRISGKNLFSLTLVKYVVNLIPPRAGELAASVALARKEKISATGVVAASVLERILDALTVLVLFGFYLAFFAHRYLPNSERGEEVFLAIQRYSAFGFLVLCFGFFVLALLLRTQRWMDWIPSKVRRLALSFLGGFRALQSRTAVAQVVILSIGIWLAITAQLWCLVQAYIEGFPFAGALLLVSLTVVGVAIPTPGGVGGFQFFMSLALVHFFSSYLSPTDLHSQAAGISNGCYIVSMIPTIMIGLIFLNHEGLSLGRIGEMGKRAPGRGTIPTSGSLPEN